MRKLLLTLSLAKPGKKPEEILKNYETFIYKFTHYVTPNPIILE